MDTSGVVHHTKDCAAAKFAGDLFPTDGLKAAETIERRVREIVVEEIIKRKQIDLDFQRVTGLARDGDQVVHYAKRLWAMLGLENTDEPGHTLREPPTSGNLEIICSEVKKLEYSLGLAKIALRKIANMDPVFAGQRAQMSMPVEHDIAKLTLAEIGRE